MGRSGPENRAPRKSTTAPPAAVTRRYGARMAHRVRVGELLLAVEGLALTRHLFGGDPGTVERRLAGMRATLATLEAAGDQGGEEPVEVFAVELSEAGVEEGYERWSASYDEAENPLLTVEEPILRTLIADLPPCTVLDACTGTGRHAALLSRLGHTVTGFDQSVHMLDRARAKVPDATFRRARRSSCLGEAGLPHEVHG